MSRCSITIPPSSAAAQPWLRAGRNGHAPRLSRYRRQHHFHAAAERQTVDGQSLEPSGFRGRQCRRNRRVGFRQYSRPLLPVSDFMSAPAEKARLPAPVSTTQRTPSSASIDDQMRSSSADVARSMAFIRSGRSIVTRATPPAMVKPTVIPPPSACRGRDRIRQSPHRCARQGAAAHGEARPARHSGEPETREA